MWSTVSMVNNVYVLTRSNIATESPTHNIEALLKIITISYFNNKLYVYFRKFGSYQAINNIFDIELM